MGYLFKPVYTNKKGDRVESRIWWIKYYRNGRQLREGSGSEKESDAKRLLKLREGDIAKGLPVSPRIGRVTIEELLTDLVTEHKANGRRSVADVERRIKKHVTPYFGGRRAAAITTADIRRFICARQEANAANAAINRELAALKRAFTLALPAGKLVARPHIPMLEERNVRTAPGIHSE
jgi:hypothetical protein